jgi:hypothetical protein
MKWTITTIAIIGIACLAWACRFKYESYKSSPVRINRFTGKTELLTGDGWLQLYSSPTKSVVLPKHIYSVEVPQDSALGAGTILTVECDHRPSDEELEVMLRRLQNPPMLQAIVQTNRYKITSLPTKLP